MTTKAVGRDHTHMNYLAAVALRIEELSKLILHEPVVEGGSITGARLEDAQIKFLSFAQKWR